MSSYNTNKGSEGPLQADQVRQKVCDLKKFYTNILTYVAVSFFCILLWLAGDRGFFWPVWVILGFFIASLSQAIRVGYLPVIENIFPFLQQNWEEEQVQAILKKERIKQKNEKSVNLEQPLKEEKPTHSLSKKTALKAKIK